ncbi:MAG: hypothetical protein JW750_08030 [Anaerolineaceae bacterium]|nr:hypothetical protein [Anaerolineaceae bacterium]
METNRREDFRTLYWGAAISLLFTALIWWAGQFLDRSMLLPDQGASWYYWKLPEPTFWTRFTAWGFYLAHQLSFWAVIYLAQKNVKKFTNKMNRYAKWALGLNAFFVVMHFIQTHIWYDGLAQDVSIWSSQISVIIMLVLILLMENRRRGLFWGKKVPFSKAIIDLVRRYHGYYIAWAVVYTFWYHPMESGVGHLMGFVYMFFLFLQGSLLYTRAHINPWWTIFLEFFVTIHGTVVAITQGNGMWQMFFFGFFGLFVFTQQFGLPLPKWTRWAVLGVYGIGAVVVYSIVGFDKLYQLVSIPLIEYLSVFAAALVAALVLLVMKKPAPIFERARKRKSHQH